MASRKKKSSGPRSTRKTRITLSAAESEMVDISLRTLPPDFRTHRVRDVLAAAIKAPELAARLRADPRRYLEECGIELRPETVVEAHQSGPNSIHIVLPSRQLLPVKPRDQAKVQITDADLVSGKFTTRLAADKKVRDGTEGKTNSDADDKGDAGVFSRNDPGDGAQDIGDRRRKKDAD